MYTYPFTLNDMIACSIVLPHHLPRPPVTSLMARLHEGGEDDDGDTIVAGVVKKKKTKKNFRIAINSM